MHSKNWREDEALVVTANMIKRRNKDDLNVELD
jgi:hypothetical protein